VSSPERHRQVAVGDGHTCAITHDRRVTCWDDNKWGQLGRSEKLLPLQPPVRVPQLEDIVQIAAHSTTTCAVRSEDVALCWGANDSGELGSPSEEKCIDRQGSCRHGAATRARPPCRDRGWLHPCVRRRQDGSVRCWELDETISSATAVGTARLNERDVFEDTAACCIDSLLDSTDRRSERDVYHRRWTGSLLGPQPCSTRSALARSRVACNRSR
jgi:hypothetical protein